MLILLSFFCFFITFATANCSINVSIPMRDGVLLTSFIILPAPCNQRYPMVLDRTPYGADGTYPSGWVPYGFATMDQNQRGCFSSGGEYDFWKQDAYDAYDTMLWIVNQTWSNGQVYTFGASAVGITQYVDAIEPRTSTYLHGQYVGVAEGYMHETSYWGGAYRTGLIKQWLDDLVSDCPNSLQIEKEVETNENMTSWWNTLELNSTLYGNFYPNIKWPIVHSGGWWDIFAYYQIQTFNAARLNADPSVRDLNWLFMDPLGHCSSSNIYFRFPDTNINAVTNLAIAVFQGDWNNTIFSQIDKINVYILGTVPGYVSRLTKIAGNYWSSFANWPIPIMTNYYLGPNKALLTTKPSTSGSYGYLYDPNNPTPMVGGNNLYGTCGPWDQSTQVENRSDVLVWTLNSTLTKNLAICGDITATLYVSSDQVDTDFVVSFNDVYPDGQSIQIRYGAIRMRWRNGPASSPILMVPGQIYEVTVNLWSTCQILDVGHSLRVSITSSSYPSYSVNPNNGLPLIQGGPLNIAKNTVYIGNATASYITVPVISENDIPPNPLIS